MTSILRGGSLIKKKLKSVPSRENSTCNIPEVGQEEARQAQGIEKPEGAVCGRENDPR